MIQQKYSQKVWVNSSESTGVIQGLYDLDTEGTNYTDLLARVVLSKFAKVTKNGKRRTV